MSMHKELKSKQEVEGLLLHKLSIGKPCQLSDAFILGMRFELKYHKDSVGRIADLEEMLSKFKPSNDYQILDGEGELCDVNYGGGFCYDEGSEEIGLEVVRLLQKDRSQ